MSNFKNKAIDKDISSGLIILLATACGIIVANLYYAQPLIGLISNEIGLSNSSAGLIVTLTQIGYVVGLLFLVPLGDIVENKKLILILLFLSAFALISMVFVKSATLLLIASFFIGLGSVAAQVLVPLVSYLSSENARGRVVGNVMSGLLLGIMLARPISSLVADMWGWNAIFALSATVIIVLAFVLSKVLPTRKPKAKTNYIALLNSMWQLLRTTPILRRRAIYHACVFGAFSLFWTTVPLLLFSPAFHFSQTAIALYALVGITGAIAAPIGGRLADLGWTRPATGIALTVVIISLILPLFIQSSSSFGIAVLVIAAILLDMGVSANLVLSQRLIFSLSPEIRSRLNGLFMAIFFLGGAVGSFIGGWAYALGGWNLTLWIGIAFPTIALLYFAREE
ncbi:MULTISPECIES: MFS transporter [Bacillus]|uniref:Bicyclomycin resistance protein n=3 Tax=Bacillus cereus group TaxID=86661 RepID=Q81BJ5_BACCR|nr:MULTISPECIES: MFS transporter [Bacillus]AAP10104.1 Bicyclomycin resistance protein [Bacillus cereus ATCC 14579]ATI60319.1 MFS transporter [Bacillus cereus]EEL10810.1 Major facilitator superfamily MFS_1 [Bacillus cereus BDRD-Cer4]KZD77389.1 Bicyclomycin resistance protein [Bacillus cereus]MCC3284929.1 MFS transporter [Bacillus cereus]